LCLSWTRTGEHLENTTGKAVNMNTSGWTAECSWIYKLIGPREKRRNVTMSPAVLRALAVALLCLFAGQPVQAQGFLKKLQAKARAVQGTAERADTVLSKAGQTTEAIKCLASEPNCVEPVKAEGPPQVAGDPTCRGLPSPAGSDTLPRHADRELRAPPDTNDS
jgi:hypothetical protein